MRILPSSGARWRIGTLLLLAALLPALLTLSGGCSRRQPPVQPPASARLQPLAGPEAIAAPHPVTSAELEEYAGSAACVTCHPREAGQLKSHHAQTLARMDRPAPRRPFSAGGALPGGDPGLVYKAVLGDSGPVFVARKGGKTAAGAPEYAFGSGNRCYTYVGSASDSPVEFRASYYRRAGRWDFTPGQQPGQPISALLGRSVKSEMEDCFLCHSTALVKEYGQVQPARSRLGIECEACHGPGKAHIEAIRSRSPDIRMVRLAAFRKEVTTRLCGKCHRGRESGDPHDPGTAGQTPRLQGFALSLSACFKRTQGGLSCVTCHDPHRNADAVSRAEYNGKCSGCHHPGTAGQKPCPVQPAGDCVSCHMPSQAVNIPTHPVFRTHWIKVWKAASR